MRSNTLRLATHLGIAATALYLLTASKTLQMGADESVVYATAESLVQHRRWDIDQMASLGKGEIWAYGMWGADGHQYGKYGPVQPILAIPLLWLGIHLPTVGPVDTVLLFNSLVTGVTVALLFWASRGMGFSPASSILAAILYGFVTFAWAYSKTFFGEPLSALFILASLAWALRLRNTGQERDAVLSSIFLGLAMGVKWSNAIVAPLLLVFVFYTTRERIRLFVTWLVPLAVTLGFLILFNAIRFGSPWESGYSPEPSFTTPILYGLWGLLLSPGKSLFLYSPILLLALPGIWLFWQKERAATLLLLGASLAQILIYAAWWAWWGGWGWGPRLLLPVTPPLVLLALPVLERVTQSEINPLPKIMVASLAIISIAIQLPGISVHYSTYLGEQSRHDPLVNGPTISDPVQSPLVAQFQYLSKPENWDFAWIDRGNIDWIHFLAKLGFAIIAGVGLWGAWRGFSLWKLLLILGISITTLGLIRGGSNIDEHHRALADHLATTPVDLVIMSDYAHQATFWNVNKLPLNVIGAPESAAISPRLEVLLGRALAQLETSGGQVVQLALAPPGHPTSGVERWLAERLYAADHRWYVTTRLLRFLMPPAAAKTERGNPEVAFGDFARLKEYQIKCAEDGLYITLVWQALASIPVPYTVSVQLLDDQSQLVAQHDGGPAAATRPTTGWQLGEIILDRHALAVPPGNSASQILVILYDPASGRRLPVGAAQGRSLGDAYPLLTWPEFSIVGENCWPRATADHGDKGAADSSLKFSGGH